MKESTIEKKVCDYAKSKGWIVYKFVSPSNKGVPDRVFYKAAQCFFIEFKSTGCKMSPLQEYHKERLEKERFKVHVVDNVEQGLNLIDSYA